MPKVKFSKEQRHTLSEYFSDISKISVGSVVVGFFIPTEGMHVPLAGFIGGCIVAIGFIVFSMYLAK